MNKNISYHVDLHYLSRNKIKDAEKKFETYDYGWLMVHDEDMIIYMGENFSFKMFSFIGHGYDFSLPSNNQCLFIHEMINQQSLLAI